MHGHTYENQLYKEVRMAVPKSTQTRVGMTKINQAQRSSVHFPYFHPNEFPQSS